MDRTKVVLGFSGGIDSCAAVGMLQDQGLSVVALTLDMCGDQKMVQHAQQQAAALGVKFASIDCQQLFNSEIKDYFTSEYLKGRTPAPCTRCNPHIKWRMLAEYADKNKIYHIATGHYFRVEQHNEKLYVARAADLRKDQSYYLWGLDQKTLARAITPMAGVIKQEIKKVGAKESMGVCFLNSRPYSEYIEQVCGDIPSGNILDKQGNIVGQHKGLAYYTVGQKRGDGIPAGSSIISIDNPSNSLIIGDNNDLYHTQLFISHCNIVDTDELLNSHDITVLVRGLGRNPEGFARSIEPYGEGYKITLSSPAWACAAGQPVVMYRGDRVIGGGYLDSSRP